MELPKNQAASEKINQKKSVPYWAIIAAFVILFAFLGLLAAGVLNINDRPIRMGEKVQPFELTTFDGQVINTADAAGKVVVINFWASWCQPCESEAADLEEAWRAYQPDGEVIFLGVDYVDTETPALAFLERYDVTYPNGPDLGSSISSIFRIRGVPETYIIDSDGNLAFMKKGPFASTDEIFSAVDAVLEGDAE